MGNSRTAVGGITEFDLKKHLYQLIFLVLAGWASFFLAAKRPAQLA